MEAMKMGFLLWIVAVIAFLGIIILWDLAIVAASRPFGIHLPFSFALHVRGPRERELQAALRGRPRYAYGLVSGVLLFACPVLAGLLAYDFVADGFVWPGRALRSVAGSVVVLATIAFWFGLRDGKKSAEQAKAENI
jgi:hypothetical protein